MIFDNLITWNYSIWGSKEFILTFFISDAYLIAHRYTTILDCELWRGYDSLSFPGISTCEGMNLLKIFAYMYTFVPWKFIKKFWCSSGRGKNRHCESNFPQSGFFSYYLYTLYTRSTYAACTLADPCKKNGEIFFFSFLLLQFYASRVYKTEMERSEDTIPSYVTYIV